MFYAIPNLASSTAFAVEAPWSYEPGQKPPAGLDKDDITRWASHVDTEYAVISGYEGLSPEVRISSDNPAHALHAFVVDYDAPLLAGAVESLRANPVSEFRPAYICRTASGNARLVWLLESPFLCGTRKHWKSFLKRAAKQIKFSKWLAGLDTEALSDSSRYFLLGSDWEPVFPDYKIPSVHLQLWFFKAAEGLKLDNSKTTEYKIPIEDLEREVHTRYPGRWRNSFSIGARGVRFWDPSADNETAAQVTADGMVCFTGDQFFVPWKQIFGSAFVDEYEADYVASVGDNCVYDGKEFWVLSDDSRWVPWGKQDFTQELRCRGYNGQRKPGKTMSEIDMIENTIKKERKVEMALPFLYHSTGRISHKGKVYLNIAEVEPLKPGAPVTAGPMRFSDGRTHFPFIYKLLVTMFTDEHDEASEQLTAFLAWLKHFYTNSLNRTPKSGHLLAIAGPTNKGKSMFVNEVLGKLMGGEPADATSHLLDGDRWTDEVAEAPIMLVDDAEASVDYRQLKLFTARLKKSVANNKMKWEKKFKSGATVPWFGRIIILCNEDPEALSVLPDPDDSTIDKFSMFKASNAKLRFPSREEITRRVVAELPYFARFLVDWVIPEAWQDEKRFGVRPYHHPDLLSEARQQGTGTVLELLDGFMQFYTENRSDLTEWQGTASHLYEDLCAYRPEFMRTMKERSLASNMGKLRARGYSLTKTRNGRGIYEWCISRNVTKIKSGAA